jgi:hypothetical protein
MQEIKFPTQTTYFIAYTNDRVCAWGEVQPNQEMSSGQPNLYQTISEEEWREELPVYHVVWGYPYPSLESAEQAKEMVDSQYGPETAQVSFAAHNDPEFWYILGDFPESLGEPESFQVFPN